MWPQVFTALCVNLNFTYNNNNIRFLCQPKNKQLLLRTCLVSNFSLGNHLSRISKAASILCILFNPIHFYLWFILFYVASKWTNLYLAVKVHYKSNVPLTQCLLVVIYRCCWMWFELFIGTDNSVYTVNWGMYY